LVVRITGLAFGWIALTSAFGSVVRRTRRSLVVSPFLEHLAVHAAPPTRNQLHTRDQMRIRDELDQRERYSLYCLDPLLPEAVQSRILRSGPNLVGRMSE
jgi:hypothetical protein